MLTGIVQEVINLGVGKGSGLKIDGHKYGCFDPVKTGIDIVAVGDEVTFDWVQKGQYKNINGAVTKTGNTGIPAASPSPKASVGSSGSNKGSWGNKGVFPVPQLDGQRSIIRQNSITNAVNLFGHVGDKNLTLDSAAEYVVAVARIFEDYSSGDDVERMANEAIAKMNAATD